jgi:hypothetical protein
VGVLHWFGSRRYREYAWLSAAFVVSRLVLHVIGLRMHLELDWMFLADPGDLRGRLLETVVYFHAFPPAMNLLTGVLLKLAPDHLESLTRTLFLVAGLVLANALYYLCRRVLRRRRALAVTLAFCVIPQCLFFEHLYLYTELVACLLCLSCALFHDASRRGTWASWVGLFLVCAAIGWLRSTFHLLWFVAVVALAAWFNPAQRRRIALAAFGPFLLLSALYLKNWGIFGAFAASTWFGGNLSQVTVARMPKAEREAWQRDGKLSAYAGISMFAGPERYAPFFREQRLDGMPDTVNRLDRPSVGAPNYNHWWLREVNRARQRDAFTCLREQPLSYLENVASGMAAMFSPSTTWHPVKGDKNPHADHRRVLGGYENLYNGLVHEVFLAPVGFYAFLPLVLGLALWKAARWGRGARGRVAARVSTIRFASFQVLYVVAVSSLVTYGEASRFRYQIEPLIWFVATAAAVALGRPKNWARRFRAWRSAPPSEILARPDHDHHGRPRNGRSGEAGAGWSQRA